MAQLLAKLPARADYQIGLLLVQWQDVGDEWLSALVSIGSWSGWWTFLTTSS